MCVQLKDRVFFFFVKLVQFLVLTSRKSFVLEETFILMVQEGSKGGYNYNSLGTLCATEIIAACLTWSFQLSP